ncbi:LAMI_0H10968g1_1 [Lachancea mirantina]|uniref:LAMI_0H10968g1_1 n=1 Tax=Lachancea mirantina TaxID=1230905 RepID=A0A1G4KH00_9SACH|nr:LAMI_0H10968g1_1 [Lachancea mirantina]
MAGFRFIDLAKPFLPLIPEVEIPYEKIGFDEKVVYTIISALIYLFTQFPLAGVAKDVGAGSVQDPIYFLRSVFASEPRTLLEFGIFPIVSSALLLQLLAGLKIVKVNFKLRQDRELFQTLTKMIAILQYFLLANVFIFSGFYGENLSVVAIVLLNVQLVAAGIFATLLVEVVDKGYGFGSGAMAVSVVATATSFVADVFGVTQFPVDGDGHREAQGAFINLTQSLRSSHKTYTSAILGAFNRDYLPNLTTAFLVVGLAAVSGWLQNFRIELSIRSTRARGINNVYPIRLLYTGGLPLLFSYVLLFYIHIGAFILIQIVAKNDPSSLIYKLLGGYSSVNNLLYVPQFPLSLLTPSKSLIENLTRQPLTAFTFTAFLVVSSVWFAVVWQGISGSSARDISVQFKEQGITLTGRREQSVAKELEKVIPVASGAGAGVLAVIVATGELLGLKGKGASIVIGITSAFALLELITVDYQQSGGQSALAQVLGAPGGGF